MASRSAPEYASGTLKDVYVSGAAKAGKPGLVEHGADFVALPCYAKPGHFRIFILSP